MSQVSRFGRLQSGTSAPLVTVGGVDVSDQLISFDVQDASAFNNGFAFTSGTLVLGDLGLTGHDIEDYRKDDFKRGTEVKVDLVMFDPSGGNIRTIRHPRGLLYVTGTAYDVEANALEISVACKLALAALTDDIDAVSSLQQLPLDPAAMSVQGISDTLAATGRVAYQDNQGDIKVVEFFDGDSFNTATQGQFVSVAGLTALSVRPLVGSDALPDLIELSSNVEVPDRSDSELEVLEAPVYTDSYYFLEYPAILYERIPNVPLEDLEEFLEGEGGESVGGSIPDDLFELPPSPFTAPGTDCGNTPPPPTAPGETAPPEPIDGGGDEDGNQGENGTVSGCSPNFTLEASTTLEWVVRKEKTFSHYRGPGGQISYSYQEVRGPAMEVNREYFADEMAYCRSVYANQCKPNGYCPLNGLKEMLQSYTETFYTYNDAGTLVKQVTDTYESQLSAAEPFDWRSGIVNGTPTEFRSLSTSGMFRTSSRVIEYEQQGNVVIETESFYQSSAVSGSGLSSVS